jgi:hypothetical protein
MRAASALQSSEIGGGLVVSVVTAPAYGKSRPDVVGRWSPRRGVTARQGQPAPGFDWSDRRRAHLNPGIEPRLAALGLRRGSPGRRTGQRTANGTVRRREEDSASLPAATGSAGESPHHRRLESQGARTGRNGQARGMTGSSGPNTASIGVRALARPGDNVTTLARPPDRATSGTSSAVAPCRSRSARAGWPFPEPVVADHDPLVPSHNG